MSAVPQDAIDAQAQPAARTAAPDRREGLYRSLWRHAEGARLALSAAFVLLVGSQLVRLAVPWFTAQAVDTLQREGLAGVGAAARWAACALGTQAGVWLLHGPGRVLERKVGVGVRRGVAASLYDRLLKAPLAWHDAHHSAELHHRMSQSSQALYHFAQTQFVYLQSAVNFVGPVVALTLVSTFTGLWALAGYGLVAFVVWRFDHALMKLARRENDAERRYAAGLLEFIGHIETVQSLRLAGSARRLLAQRLDSVFAPLARSIGLTEARWCVVDLMSAVLTWGLVAAYMVHEVLNRTGAAAAGPVMMGTVILVYQYAQQAGGVVGSIASNVQNFARTRTDFASGDPIRQAPQWAHVEARVPADWQRIDIRDLCHSHRVQHAHDDGDSVAALHHVSLSLKRGERIALVGPSGCGKSTLMRVLGGLYEPSQVQIRVDGASRPDLTDLSSISTMIPQEPDVFEATARENIVFDGEVDDTALQAAIHASAFDTVAARWAAGLDQPISERGANLSGGQRQRLALARGLYAARDRSLLMLDEPTSALDAVTEAAVMGRIGALHPQACLIAAVHRLSLLDRFDRVVLMAAGEVLDVGSVDELRARQPLFAQLLADSGADAAVGGLSAAAPGPAEN